MTTLNTINYSNSNYNQPQISASTKRKLESLGIDPTLVSSESQALSLIAKRQSEKSFEQYAVEQNNVEPEQTQPNNSTETDLIAQAKNLAEELGLSVESGATFEEITALISNAIQELVNKSNNDPLALQRAQQYQVLLSNLTNEYSSASSSTSELYSAMAFQANNTRYLLGL